MANCGFELVDHPPWLFWFGTIWLISITQHEKKTWLGSSIGPMMRSQARRHGGGGEFFFPCQLSDRMAMIIPLPHYEKFLDKFLKSEEKKCVGVTPPPPPPIERPFSGLAQNCSKEGNIKGSGSLVVIWFCSSNVIMPELNSGSPHSALVCCRSATSCSETSLAPQKTEILRQAPNPRTCTI